MHILCRRIERSYNKGHIPTENRFKKKGYFYLKLKTALFRVILRLRKISTQPNLYRSSLRTLRKVNEFQKTKAVPLIIFKEQYLPTIIFYFLSR